MLPKYTIVIPTLWKSNRIHTLLKNLIECDYVDEIILIDNSSEFKNYYDKLDKVIVLTPVVNIYVNPAWNYGVKLSKNNCIAIINDDITFDTKIFGKLDEETLKTYGFVGMDGVNYEILNDDETKWEIKETKSKPYGWGCLILFHKENWMPIPEEMKIWYGDNYMCEINPAPKMILTNFKVDTEMSSTSDNPMWVDVKNRDTDFYIKNIKNY
jgi:hypothetical protein